jgi:hypothetical protein
MLRGHSTWVRVACQKWLKGLLFTLCAHGDALTMALVASPGDVPLSDNLSLADDFIHAAACAGWIQRGVHAATLMQRNRSGACSTSPYERRPGYPTEWNWTPGPRARQAERFVFLHSPARADG